VDILSFCTDMSKLLLGIVSHRCSGSVLCLLHYLQKYTTGKNTFPLTFQIIFIFPEFTRLMATLCMRKSDINPNRGLKR